MAALVVRRLGLSVITLALVSILIFAATELLPGDMATALLGRDATPDALAALREKLGLERPAVDRYVDWVTQAARGDLGVSAVQDEAITTVLGDRLRNTLLLAGVAIVIGIPLAVLLGVISGLTRDRLPDLGISILALIGMSLPEFVVGSLLILLFALIWPIFPAVTTVQPNASLQDLLPYVWLPAITLTIGMVAYIARMTRTNLIDVLESDFVRMATLKGLRWRRVITHHAFPNALIPTVNVIAVTIAWLVGGVVVVEAVFNYPGIGTLTVKAVQTRDVALIQALSLLGAAFFIVITLLADLLILALNPRLRTLRG